MLSGSSGLLWCRTAVALRKVITYKMAQPTWAEEYFTLSGFLWTGWVAKQGGGGCDLRCLLPQHCCRVNTVNTFVPAHSFHNSINFLQQCNIFLVMQHCAQLYRCTFAQLQRGSKIVPACFEIPKWQITTKVGWELYHQWASKVCEQSRIGFAGSIQLL